MRISWLAVAILGNHLLCPAQLTGRFSLEKATFAPGEPVVLSFTTTNGGFAPQSIQSADPYSFCSGLSVHLSSDPTLDSCGPLGFAVSCISGATTVSPGKSHTERILLNFDHKLNGPGDYDVEAAKSLTTYAELDNLSSNRRPEEFHQTLHFRIVEGAIPPPDTFDQLRDQLASPDKTMRREAARTLAALAPPALASTLLLFPTQSDFKEFAPLALHNLNTPAGNSALAEMLLANPQNTHEYLEAARYLAQSHDPAWFPVLEQVARNNHNTFPYLQDAAQSGEDRALPLLLQSMRRAETPSEAWTVAQALGYTGSKAAVPLLLDLLRNSDPGVSQSAMLAFQRLTHLRVGDPPRFGLDNPRATEPLWVQWWAENKASARIYKADECGEYTLLR